MAIIDAHTHFFSRAFFEALVAQQSPPGAPSEVLPALATKTGLEIPSPDAVIHAQRWLAEMDRHGIGHMVTFASLPEESDAVIAGVREAKGRLTAYCLINPTRPECPNLLDRLVTQGFRGVLLFPVMHRYRMNDEHLFPVLDAIEERGLIVLVHFGLLQVKVRDALGLPRPFDVSCGNPLDLQRAANRARRTTFVIPHFGCGFFRETLMLGSQCENVCVDTSSSNSWMATQESELTLEQVFRRAKGVFGAERVLFGTDSGVFPRGYREDLLKAQIDASERAGYTAAERDLVFGENAARLLNLPAT